MNANGLTLEEQATNAETSKHIRLVGRFLHLMVKLLLDRVDGHDLSKLDRPEVELFTKYTPMLAELTYGSDEFNACKAGMGPALDHHYAKNAHHPEHFKPGKPDPELFQDIAALEALDGGMSEKARDRLVARLRRDLADDASSICGMTLIDLLEMFCDWKASSMRHNDGNIRKSVEINAGRFKMSPQLVRILENTAALLDGVTG